METSGEPDAFPVVDRLGTNTPIVLDLGCQSREDIELLGRGEGNLTTHICAAAGEARQSLGISPDKEIVPVVLLYRRVERDYKVIYLPVRDEAGE
jgi:hypothetical protein